MSVEVKKQVSIFLPVSDWRALYLEAARQRVPVTELCRRWILPEIQQLPRDNRRLFSKAESSGAVSVVSRGS